MPLRLPRLPSPRDIAADLMATVLRFPLPAIAALGLTASYLASHHRFPLFWPLASNGVASEFFLLALFASLLAKLTAERFEWTGRYVGGVRGLLLAALLLTLVGYAASLSMAAGRFPWFVGAFPFMLGGLAFLTMAVAWRAGPDGNAAFWAFNRLMLTGAAFGWAVALTLALGLSAIVQALEILFGFDPPRYVLRDIWTVSFCLVWPLRALASIPPGFDPPTSDYCPAWIRFLARFLYVPLATVYLLILYAFAVKIAVQWELPRGQVAWLVCGFAVVGVATKLVIYPLRQSGDRLLRLFDRVLFPALFLPAGLLAVAVWLRVDAYGVTENRYLLILLTIWLFGLAIVFSLGMKRLVAIPLSLGIMLVFGGVGPWSAANVSFQSQIGRLEAVLGANDLLRNGKLMKVDGSIPFEDNKRLSALVSYLSKPVRRPRFAAWLDGRAADLDLSGDWRPRQFMAALGLPYVWPNQDAAVFNYRTPHSPTIAVAGFDLVSQRRFWTSHKNHTIEDPASARRYALTFSPERSTLSLSDGAGAPVSFDLDALVRALGGVEPSANAHSIAPGRMTLDATTPSMRIRVLVTGIQGRADGDRFQIGGLDVVVLIAAVRP